MANRHMKPNLKPPARGEDTALNKTADNGALQERNELLKGIPYEVVRKAWFTLSHLLLDDGAHIADMGCGDGQMAYAMAVLNPKMKITAIDKSKRLINK